MTYYDVVRKLIGPIEPLGETYADEKRFKNLIEMKSLVEELLQDLIGVSQSKNSYEGSVQKAGKSADEFLQYLGELFSEQKPKEND